MSESDAYDESETVTCSNCELRFEIIADNDSWIQWGRRFDNYCPRCGELMPDREVW